MTTFETLFPIPTGGRNADDMGMPSNWPPRFTFTPEGIAGLFLRKHFATASEEHQQELASLLRECVEQERERCAELCEAEHVLERIDAEEGHPCDLAYNQALLHAADAIRGRGQA